MTGLIAAFVAALTIVIFTASAPRFTDLREFQIAPSDVVAFSHEGNWPFRRRRVNETVFDLHSASQIPIKTRRQYTYTFKLNEMTTERRAVFLPSIGGAATVYINGVRTGEARDIGPHFPGFSKRFFLEDIPITAYQTGINRLTIVMTPDGSFAGLPAIFIGPREVFSSAAQRQIQRLHVLRKCQVIFGIGLIFLAVLGLYCRARIRPYVLIFILGIGLTVLGFLSRPQALLSSEALWRSAGLIYGVMAMTLIGLTQFKRLIQRPMQLGLWIAALISILIGAAILLPISRPLYTHSFVYFCTLGIVPFAVFFAGFCLKKDWRFLQSSRAGFAQKIAEQDAIILAQEAAIEEGLKAKGRMEERQRLTRDIHDGIGGQLLSLLVRVRGGDMSPAEIESDLQYGLNDLRLIVDSMDHSETTLDSAFLTFRTRAKTQLSAAGISLKWEQPNPFVPTYLGPAAILNVFRLMQEALTNAIRHAQCDHITVHILQQKLEDDLTIAIADNGLGFDPEKKLQAGQGLKNMCYRAKALGGTLHFQDGALGGTKITLTIPPERKNEDVI